ncbi:MAG: ATP-binding protein [Bacteroidia bacterium]|nr:ATP-binding protein [Bacteroidia bacterium]
MNNQHQIVKTKLPDVKKIIIVTSGKGGVGKSTIASGLALTLAREGYSVGLLDADIFGPSIPTLFKIKDEARPTLINKNGKNLMEPFIRLGLKIMSIGFFFDEKQAVVWRGPMVTNAIKQLLTETEWGQLDYLIIDTPPGTGDVLITLLQNFYISGAIVVTTPQKMSIADVQKAINMLQDEHIGIPILGIVENMSWFTPTKHTGEKYFIFGQGGAQKLSEVFNLPVLAQIPINELICQDCDKGNLSDIFEDTNIDSAFKQLAYDVINQKKKYQYIRE